MLGPSSSLIAVSKTTNPRWTAPEVIKNSQIGPAGDGGYICVCVCVCVCMCVRVRAENSQFGPAGGRVGGGGPAADAILLMPVPSAPTPCLPAVYSFAIIMWEMLTWQQPFEEMMSVQVIFSAVTDDTRPLIPADNELPGTPGKMLQHYKVVGLPDSVYARAAYCVYVEYVETQNRTYGVRQHYKVVIWLCI